MKFLFLSLVPATVLLAVPLTDAVPVPSSSSLNAREPLVNKSSLNSSYSHNVKERTPHDRSPDSVSKLEAHQFFDEDLERRGLLSKISKTSSKIMSGLGGSSKGQKTKDKPKPESPKLLSKIASKIMGGGSSKGGKMKDEPKPVTPPRVNSDD